MQNGQDVAVCKATGWLDRGSDAVLTLGWKTERLRLALVYRGGFVNCTGSWAITCTKFSQSCLSKSHHALISVNWSAMTKV